MILIEQFQSLLPNGLSRYAFAPLTRLCRTCEFLAHVDKSVDRFCLDAGST